MSTAPRLKPVDIGPVRIEDPVILAPMSGVSDMPFRQMVKRGGAGLVVSEMIASAAMVRENRKTLLMAKNSPEEFPMAVQLAGCEPEVMADAARLVADARRAACRQDPRGHGEGGQTAGDAQDAHRLGLEQPQRPEPRPHRRA